MVGIIESTIKTTPLGRWYIELIDTMNVQAKGIVCMDIYEYADKIEEIGKAYEESIEVIWSSDDNVTPEQINEVRMQMNAYEAEQEAKREKMEHMPDGTPNFDTSSDFGA